VNSKPEAEPEPESCPHLISEVKFSKVQLEQENDNTDKLDVKGIKLQQEKIGVLSYVADAVFGNLQLAVGKIGENMANPTTQLMEQADHLLRYLQNNADRALVYVPSDMILRAHSDASYGCETNSEFTAASYCANVQM